MTRGFVYLAIYTSVSMAAVFSVAVAEQRARVDKNKVVAYCLQHSGIDLDQHRIFLPYSIAKKCGLPMEALRLQPHRL